jgi:hypothetical protein
VRPPDPSSGGDGVRLRRRDRDSGGDWLCNCRLGTRGTAAAGRSGYVNLPGFVFLALLTTLTAPIGARLAHRLPQLVLKARVRDRCSAVLALNMLREAVRLARRRRFEPRWQRCCSAMMVLRSVSSIAPQRAIS